MDAFVTRAPSAGPSRTRDSKRLLPSHAVPSFFAASKSKPNEGDNLKASHKSSSSSSNNTKDKGKGRASTEAPPNIRAVDNAPYKRAQSAPAAHSGKLKQAVINVTRSLKSADNPVTHSSAYSGAFHYVSCSSGHQTSNGKSREGMNSHTASRNAKLKAQGAEAKNSIFSGVRAYINGTTMPLISNLDLIRLIQENGGDVKYAFSKTGCTHIICVHGLSSQKTHKELNSRSKTKVVTPEWVLDSISEGKKLAETRYKIINSDTQSSIRATFEPILIDSKQAKIEAKNEEDDGFLLLPVLRSSKSASPASMLHEPISVNDSDDEGSVVEAGNAIFISSSQ